MLVSVGPYVAIVLAAALAGRALLVAGGRPHRVLADRLALLSVPLAILFVVTIALRFLMR